MKRRFTEVGGKNLVEIKIGSTKEEIRNDKINEVLDEKDDDGWEVLDESDFVTEKLLKTKNKL